MRNPTKDDRVLILAPHPDDESLGCFGYISRAIKAKAKVRVVVLTDGHFLAQPERRYKETLQTLSEIGLSKKEIFFLGFKDIQLNKSRFCEDVILDTIKSFKPTKIFCTSKHDSNIDHRTAYFYLKKALKRINKKPKTYFYLIHRNPLASSFSGGYKPESNIYPPTSLFLKKYTWFKLELDKEERELKNKAIMNYKSQLRKILFVTRKKLLALIRANELFYSEDNPSNP